VLYQLAIIARAKRVFEMGSAIGYSTIWLARAVGEGGASSTPTVTRKRRQGVPLLRTCRSQRPHYHPHGDALELLSKRRTLRHHLQRRRQNDYPCLPHGSASSEEWRPVYHDTSCGAVASQAEPDAETKAILELNKLMYQSPDVFTTILRCVMAVGVRKK